MTENSHIEEFFKKQLSSHEFAFQEEDWLKMEKKLGLSGINSFNITPVHFQLKVVIIILAAITMAFFLGWLTNELLRKSKETKEESIHSPEPSDMVARNKKLLPLEKISPDHVKMPGTEKFLRTEPRQNIDLPVSSDRPSDNAAGNITDQPDLTDNLNFHRILADSLAKSTKGIGRQNNELIPERKEKLIQIRQLNHIKRLSYDHSGLHPALTAEESHAGKPGGRFHRLSVGLLIAPDLNSTGLLHQKRASPVYGGIFTYALSSRWWLSARILYNNKKYRSSSEYYHVTDEYWQYRTNGILPDIIDGSCHVLDIPVLLTYRFYHKKTVSLTASAGPGSYFLFDEKYQFTFAQDNPGAATQWQTKENSKVILGVVNLALGMSFQTGQRTSIGIEPYLKLPLKQMGWGKVNLSGMGLSFSVNYRL